MPENNQGAPVSGDGVLTIPIAQETGEEKMPLEDEILKQTFLMIHQESAGNIQASNRRGRDLTDVAIGILQGGMAQKANELGTIESKAHSGLIATPIASPAVKAV